MALPLLGIVGAATKSAMFWGTKGTAKRWLIKSLIKGVAFGVGEGLATTAWDWLKDKTGNDWGDTPHTTGEWINGGVCYEYEGASVQLIRDSSQAYGAYDRIDSITYVGRVFIYSKWQWEYTLTGLDLNGKPVTVPIYSGTDGPGTYRTEPLNGSSSAACKKGPGTDPDGVAEPPPPHVYEDPETGCKYIAEFQNWTVDQYGRVQPVWHVGSLQKGGGGIAFTPDQAEDGCWAAPVVAVGDGTQDPDNFPLPAPDDPFQTPDVIDPTVDGAQEGAKRALEDYFNNLLLPEVTYDLSPVCNDKDSKGNKVDPVEIAIAESPVFDALSARLDALNEIQQALKDFKQPVCLNEKGDGDYRTISFISDEQSPNGDGRLRKRFRYRSKSGIELGGVVDHWKDFTFAAGPVCVKHSGSALGSPQVWAVSADEGKRVIFHAGAEAGIDPYQTGQWTVGGSDNPRYGMPGTMRVNTKGGYYWITARLEPDNRPEVVPT